MVTVVLLTTLLTPLIMRGAFMIHCPEDAKEQKRGSSDNAFEYSSIAESEAEV
jgi:hypothetical protein